MAWQYQDPLTECKSSNKAISSNYEAIASQKISLKEAIDVQQNENPEEMDGNRP